MAGLSLSLGLGLGSMRRTASAAFSPATLFAASEPGAWYDPSDLSTMFQDSAGTTPVTATGQTVGLVLDKSKGLVLGSELVSNGGFDSDTSWTKGTDWTISGGVATKVAGTGSGIEQTVALTAGKTYQITFTATVTAGGMNAAFYGGTPVSGPVHAASGTYTVRLVALTGNNLLAFIGGATFAGTIDNISVKELPGNHLTQATAASRPQYQVDGNGKAFLLFDGTDDFLVTPTITPGIDKAQVFAGVRKLSDAAGGVLVEHSAAVVSNAGSLSMSAPSGAAPNYLFRTRGSASQVDASYTDASVAAPITNVLTGICDIAADTAILRVNGVQSATSAADQGTGNYLAYPLYIGRRGGTALPFNGRIYGLVTRFGANLTADQITQTEAWMNSKTGAF